MRASYKWLRALSGVDVPAEEMARRLTSVGLEVDSVTHVGALEHVVIAEVRAKKAHPEKSGLTLVTVFDGEAEGEIVCGAPNVPEPGRLVVLAKLGASLPNGMVIAERKVAGFLSRGMLCGETELGIGPDDDGIVVLPDDLESLYRGAEGFGVTPTTPVPGMPVAEALDLRDAIIEIGLTPNRPDGLGHVGLARELALVSKQPFEAPAPGLTLALVPSSEGLSDADRPVHVRIDAPERCPRYGGARVDGVTVGPSPWWARYRLHVLGLRPISNVVDVTNLVMMERGHPVHAFDERNVRGGAIIVRTARAGETMQTLDGVARTFTEDDLLICDAERPVAVAGVMGGEESGVTEATKAVVIECAYFDPRSVRRTARRLGMHTDASHRFERGTDPRAIPEVLARTTELVARLAGGAARAHAVDAYTTKVAPKRVTLRFPAMDALLGFAVPREEARRILLGLGLVIVEDGGDALVLEAPTYRPDLAIEEDLFEEVARVYGYDHIPARVPRVRPSVEGSSRRATFLRRAKRVAVATGLHEAMSFGFVAPADLERCRVSTDALALANPLSVERSVMRTSLLPGLVEAAGRAHRHGARSIRLFEVGRSFHPRAGETLPHEHAWLALLLLGERTAWFGRERPLDFYDAKGHLEAIVEGLLGVPVELALDDGLDVRAPYLHPRRRGVARVAGTDVGVIGELHPDVVDATDVGGRAVYAELDLEALLTLSATLVARGASAPPRFPSVTLDVALLVSETVSVGALRDVMLASSNGLAERIELFDEYRGEHVPAGKRSLAFRVVYRDKDATLTDARALAAHAAVVREVETRFEAVRR